MNRVLPGCLRPLLPHEPAPGNSIHHQLASLLVGTGHTSASGAIVLVLPKMHLLARKPSSDEFQLVNFRTNVPPYAILSHTWIDGEEVTYDDVLNGTGKHKTGYSKIRFCAERAAHDNLHFFWVDTCCINKSDSQDLQTAINSMFRWYQRASKCYVYLSDLRVLSSHTDLQVQDRTWQSALPYCRWFKRGWTLQELLAPTTIEFYSQEGVLLGNKASLEEVLSKITTIPLGAFGKQTTLSQFSIAERLSWAAHRETTLVEDEIYCLFGIFNVCLPLLYGEGKRRAFGRLIREIKEHLPKSVEIHVLWTCCNCGGGPSSYAICPACFECGHILDDRCEAGVIERTRGDHSLLISRWSLID